MVPICATQAQAIWLVLARRPCPEYHLNKLVQRFHAETLIGLSGASLARTAPDGRKRISVSNSDLQVHPMPRAGICLCITFVLATSVLSAINIADYMTNKSRRWFADDLPQPEFIHEWTDTELDTRLHELSRWDGFSPAQFQSFVNHQISPLSLNITQHFRYLEVGVGVGAFARHILNTYPNASGIGIDIVEPAIRIAKTVLPAGRMHLLVANMLSIPALDNTFDYVLVPGSLCYLDSFHSMLQAISEFVRVLKPGGGLCASMLPSSTSNMGSCNIRVPKNFWILEAKQNYNLDLISMEEMDSWNLPHALGRYSVCSRKHMQS